MSKLKELTGKDQAPCLVVGGKPILESDDITKHLVTNRDNIQPEGLRRYPNNRRLQPNPTENPPRYINSHTLICTHQLTRSQ
jgi:hypothetical protein